MIRHRRNLITGQLYPKPDGVYGRCNSCRLWGTPEEADAPWRHCQHPINPGTRTRYDGGCAWRLPTLPPPIVPKKVSPP